MNQTKHILAWYNPHTDETLHRVVTLDGKPDSDQRRVSVAAYERETEALTGQGCEIGAWDFGWWSRGYRDWVMNRDFLKKRMARKQEKDHAV